jgi:hypothetical protein
MHITSETARSFAAAPLALVLGCLALLFTSAAHAQVAESVTLPPGAVRASLSLGTVRIDGERTSTMAAGLRVGLPERFALAGPLAVAWTPVQTVKQSGFSIAAGVTEMWINRNRRVLWTPAIAMAAKFRTAHAAAVFAAVDWMWLATDFAFADTPAYLRGATALMVEMGPYLTWSFGVAYQRMVIDGTPPEAIHRSGLAGGARVSLGSVRATPFEELPLFAIRLSPVVDVIFLVRLDLDTDTDTTDQRFLSGIRLNLNRPSRD